MESDDDERFLEVLRAQADATRQHASFYAWHDRSARGKGVAETGIVRDLLEAMAAANRTEYSRPRPSNDDWPDCVIEDLEGRNVAVEVTELVDGQAMPAGPARPWEAGKAVSSIQALLNTKDAKSFGKTAFAATLLVIHTDEMYLNPRAVSEELAAHRFTLPYGNLSRAFLLFSYDPQHLDHRYCELALAS